MFSDKDLDIMVVNKDGFEAYIHDLIILESIPCGIPIDKVSWDYRIDVPDGGRDIEIDVGSTNYLRHFIPQNKSIWSIKSGNDALKQSTLEKEITSHPKVLKHLKNNGSYMWCVAVPASNNERDKLKEKVDKLSRDYEFDKDLIHFYFRDTLTVWTKLHPSIIPSYFNSVPHRWKTIKEWATLERFFKVPWVNFSNRSDLMLRVRNHFYDTETHNILHLVGQSGIGKSRTVYEACSMDNALRYIVYFENIDLFSSEYENYITNNDNLHSMVVIDDVSIEEWDKLNYRLSEYKDRIRIVTIGPIPKGKIDYYDEIVLVTPPNNISDISRVIQSYDLSVSNDQASEIANWCSHDLRLALYLSEANKRDPGFRNKPILNVKGVLDRVISLYKAEIGDGNEFLACYSIFSLFIDFGYANKYRNEIAYLSKYFSKPEPVLDRMISIANNCGLVNIKGDFFEASPRALARFVFEDRGWDYIKSSASKFISGMPTYQMQKRFIERGFPSCFI